MRKSHDIYALAGQQADASISSGTVRDANGDKHIAHGGYWMPYYKPASGSAEIQEARTETPAIPYVIDSAKEREEQLQRLRDMTVRLYKNAEPMIEIRASDVEIIELRKQFESLPEEDPEKRVTGAMLFGAMACRVEHICNELTFLETQNLADGKPTDVTIKSMMVENTIRLMNELTGYLIPRHNNRCDMGTLAKYVRLRDGTPDKDGIIPKLLKGIENAYADDMQSFYHDRRDEAAQAMACIDTVKTAMQKYADNKPLRHPSLDHAWKEAQQNYIESIATLAKKRVGIRGGDKMNYWPVATSFISSIEQLDKFVAHFCDAMEKESGTRISPETRKRCVERLEPIAEGAKLMFTIADRRTPHDVSAQEFSEKIENEIHKRQSRTLS